MSKMSAAEAVQTPADNAAEKTPDTFENLFSKLKEDVTTVGNLYRGMKAALNKIERQHAIEVKAALKARPVRKPKEPREKVPMPVPVIFAKHLGIEEKMLDRDTLLGRVFEKLKDCKQEKIEKEPNEKGKKTTETCYVANDLCEKIFDDVKAGDLIPVLIVNSKVKSVCERDPAFAKYKKALDDKKKHEKEVAAAAKKEAAAAKKAAAAAAAAAKKAAGSKKSAKPAPAPINAAPAKSAEEDEFDEDDVPEQVVAPVAKKRVVRKK